METITLYQLSDEILNGSKIILHFFPCRLLPPNSPHLIMLSASSSSFSKQSSHIGIGMKIINKELEPPVSESSIKISKFHAPTDSEHKFHKTRIENCPPIEFQLGFPWLRIRKHNYWNCASVPKSHSHHPEAHRPPIEQKSNSIGLVTTTLHKHYIPPPGSR